jgi:hypothetical protein
MKLNITFAFALVLSCALFLTLLSGCVSLWLAAQIDLSNQQIALFDNCTATWQMGVGSIFGLLGGKATELFSKDVNP